MYQGRAFVRLMQKDQKWADLYGKLRKRVMEFGGPDIEKVHKEHELLVAARTKKKKRRRVALEDEAGPSYMMAPLPGGGAARGVGDKENPIEIML